MDAEYCRQRAMECVVQARRTDLASERRQTLAWVAYQWVQLAKVAQRIDEVAEVKGGGLEPLPAQPDWRGGDPPPLV